MVHNVRSGADDDTIPHDLAGQFELVTIEEASSAIDAALDSGSLAMVAVWGGDGSMRTVAQCLAGSGVALLACPGGTHNHFANDVGLGTVEAVREALAAERSALVDVGMAGTRVFLNNANAGWYVDLVSRRERLERWMPRRLAKIFSVAVQLTRLRRLHLELDGEAHTVWVAWVGNGRFALRATRMAERDNLADGKLDVRLLTATSRFPKLRVLGVLLRGGDVGAAGVLERKVVDRCTFRFRRESVRFALDGEIVRLSSPVDIVCRPMSLTVIAGAAEPLVESGPVAPV